MISVNLLGYLSMLCTQLYSSGLSRLGEVRSPCCCNYE